MFLCESIDTYKIYYIEKLYGFIEVKLIEKRNIFTAILLSCVYISDGQRGVIFKQVTQTHSHTLAHTHTHILARKEIDIETEKDSLWGRQLK